VLILTPRTKTLIPGLSSAQVKNAFLKLIQPVAKLRSLGQLVGDLETKPRYLSDFPKRPMNAMFMYMHENRQRLLKENGKISAVCIEIFWICLISDFDLHLQTEISKLAAEEFRKLPENERAVWESTARGLHEEYTENLKVFQ
jgi:hypothetical protein